MIVRLPTVIFSDIREQHVQSPTAVASWPAGYEVISPEVVTAKWSRPAGLALSRFTRQPTRNTTTRWRCSSSLSCYLLDILSWQTGSSRGSWQLITELTADEGPDAHDIHGRCEWFTVTKWRSHSRAHWALWPFISLSLDCMTEARLLLILHLFSSQFKIILFIFGS